MCSSAAQPAILSVSFPLTSLLAPHNPNPLASLHSAADQQAHEHAAWILSYRGSCSVPVNLCGTCTGYFSFFFLSGGCSSNPQHQEWSTPKLKTKNNNKKTKQTILVFNLQ
eukprot:gene2221-1385_t